MSLWADEAWYEKTAMLQELEGYFLSVWTPRKTRVPFQTMINSVANLIRDATTANSLN